MSIDFKLRDQFLLAEILEDISIDNVNTLFLETLKEAKNSNIKKILIDIRNVKFLVNTLDRFNIGEFMAEKAKFKFKIAVIAPLEQIKKRFVETVARNRGLDILAFLEEKEAINWLLK